MVPPVQAAFIARAGSLGNTIPFQQLGSVIDAIILALPLERPQRVEGSPSPGSIGCSGSELPYGHIEIRNGSTSMCLGNSVTLELVVDAGGGPNPSFRWYANTVDPANLIGTNKTITISPATLGTFVYAAQICNSDGCYTLYSNNNNPCSDPRNTNGFKVTVSDCSSCSFSAAPTSVNTPCKGMRSGQINLALTNVPANFQVSYTGNTSVGFVSGAFAATGATVSIPNLPDGSYNIILEDLLNSSCRAYSNVIVNYTTAINEYIDASKTQAMCLANVNAVVRELPAPCNWKVQAYVDVFFQWENPVNFGIQTSTGISTLDKSTRIAMRPEIDEWNNVPVSEQTFTLNSGDRMDFFTALTNTPGAQQLRAYTIKVFDENNTLVHTVVAPAGAAQPDAPYHAGGYTVTCPNPVPPAYTFTWSPVLTSINNTHSTSSGTVNIDFTSPTVYTVTAQHPTNSQCILTDTVIIQPTCPTALPVEFISFEASVENSVTTLAWITASEENCREYDIERSTNGIHFETIGNIPCNNRTTLNEYLFNDVLPSAGRYYYRIHQKDIDGAALFSAIRQVSLQDLVVRIQPNPFDEATTVRVEGAEDETIKISVTDLTGKTFHEEYFNSSGTIRIGNEFTSGIYILRLSYQNTVKNYKIVKQ